MAEVGREIDDATMNVVRRFDGNGQQNRGDQLFYSTDINRGMQRQMIRSDSGQRGDTAAYADQRSLRFNPDSVEGENWRARREGP
jgi:hypothetical protein